MDIRDIENRFAFHSAETETKKAEHEMVRAACRTLAKYLLEMTPSCREQSLAITKLEEVMFWSNAALARPPVH